MSPRNESKTIDARIKEDAQKTESLFSSACIYKVPKELRKLKKSAYTPRLIAIGPLHHNDKHLKTPMQYVKGSYTDCLLSRLITGEVTDNELAKQKRYRILEECLAEMKLLLDRAKKCYADEVELDVEMLMVDGCFIIELLYRSLTGRPPGVEGNIERSSKADPIFGSLLTAETVKLDLLIIENQIPFFVLEKLFRLTIDKIPNRPNKKTLEDLTCVYFRNMMSPENNSTAEGSATTTSCGLPLSIFGNKTRNTEEKEVVISTGEYYHILHILHEYYRPLNGTRKTRFNEQMPSASNLEYAGVKFAPGEGNNLFNIKFTEHQGLLKFWHRATFEIPTLGISDSTETFLRNMIAFEQCCHEVSQHFTSYGYLMDMLINSKEDVESLEKAGVMRNYLGANEDATDLFNKLCKEVGVGEFFFADECDKATKYGKRFWPKNMAHLKRTYFASPWTFKAFCAGFIAFVISVIQFVEKYLK